MSSADAQLVAADMRARTVLEEAGCKIAEVTRAEPGRMLQSETPYA